MLTPDFNSPSFGWKKAARQCAGGSVRQAEQRYDVIVVGGGLTGLNAAYGAAKSGASTLLLEGDCSVGAIARHNGGIAMDGLEMDEARLIKIFGARQIGALLKAAHNGVYELQALCAELGRPDLFEPTGYLTGFATGQQAAEFASMVEARRAILPEFYDAAQFACCKPGIVRSEYFRHGAVHSPHGGILKTTGLIRALATKLRTMENATMLTNSRVHYLEPARGGTRLFVHSKRHEWSVNGTRIILTGQAAELMASFPRFNRVSTGMVYTSPLPEYLLRRSPPEFFRHLPLHGPETLCPDYYRFITIEGKWRLLFGGSGRLAPQDAHWTMQDVKRGLVRNFPAYAEALERGNITLEKAWSCVQDVPDRGAPVVAAYRSNGEPVKKLHLEPHPPAIFCVGGLGGQGNVLSGTLARAITRYAPPDRKLLQILANISESEKIRPLPIAQRLAYDRLQIAQAVKEAARLQAA